MTDYRRADRVARSLQDELSSLIRREVRDPRVKDVTLTRIDMTPDLREATVWFTPLGGIDDDDRVAELAAGLKKAAPFLQGRAGRALRLRNTPRLRFRYDKGVANLVHMHELMATMQTSSPEESDEDGSDEAAESNDG